MSACRPWRTPLEDSSNQTTTTTNHPTTLGDVAERTEAA